MSERCPSCRRMTATRQYGGERGEAGPFLICLECGFDEEDQRPHDITIFWPAELPVPAFDGEIGDRRIVYPAVDALYNPGNALVRAFSDALSTRVNNNTPLKDVPAKIWRDALIEVIKCLT